MLSYLFDFWFKGFFLVFRNYPRLELQRYNMTPPECKSFGSFYLIFNFI